MELLLKAWQTKNRGRQAMLCSVVSWKGSVPRKDYPMMLVMEDGTIVGTIGGGSMELKVVSMASEMLPTSNIQLLDFDMTGDDVDGDIGLCGGTIQVLVEPFTLEVQSFYTELLEQAWDQDRLMVKLQIHQEQPIKVNRTLIRSPEVLTTPDPDLTQKLKASFHQQQTTSFQFGESLYLMWQGFTPPTLHIFGAGHVGQAVAEIAHFNDLRVKVYDDRTELITPPRFPYATRLETGFPIKWELFSRLSANDYILIASREHKHDRELLFNALKTPSRYIGLVSSTRKWKLLASNLSTLGYDDDDLSRVRAPVGVDIKAQTVPEIAISILSEIIAVYRGKSA